MYERFVCNVFRQNYDFGSAELTVFCRMFGLCVHGRFYMLQFFAVKDLIAWEIFEYIEGSEWNV